MRGAARRGMQYRSRTIRSHRDASAAPRSAHVGRPDLLARRHAHRGQCDAGRRTESHRAGENLGRRRCGIRRRHALRGPRAKPPRRTEPEVFQPRSRRHLVQLAFRSGLRPQRHHGARHPVRQPGPAGGRAGAADRVAAHPDHDRHRRLQRCRFRAVSVVGLSLLPPPSRH